MVFNIIGFWLLALAVPLWAFRWFAYSRLDAQERRVFKKIITRRHENPYLFCLQMFGYLIALAAAVLVLVFGLRYFKNGSLELGAYRETIRSRFYSGVEPFDRSLDTFHYDQPLLVAILTTCILLSVAFTLVATALRDITILKRLEKKLSRMKDRQRSLGKA